ncbi:MAG: hypothetical protein V3U02_06595, partial [Calditrichia bacterium]
DFADGCIFVEGTKELCYGDNYDLSIDGNVLSFDKFVNGYMIELFDGTNIILIRSSGVSQLKAIGYQFRYVTTLGEPEPPILQWHKTRAEVGDTIQYITVKTDYGVENTIYDDFELCGGKNVGLIISPSGDKSWYIQKNYVDSPGFHSFDHKVTSEGVWTLKGRTSWLCVIDSDGDGIFENHYAWSEKSNTATLTVSAPTQEIIYKTPVISNIVADARTIQCNQNFKISAKVTDAEFVKLVIIGTTKGHEMTDIDGNGVYSGVLHYNMFGSGTQQIAIVAQNGDKTARKIGYVTVVRCDVTPIPGKTPAPTPTPTCEELNNCKLPAETPVPTGAPGCVDEVQPDPTEGVTFEPEYNDGNCIIGWGEVKLEEPCPGFWKDPSCTFKIGVTDKISNWFGDNMKSIQIFVGVFGGIMLIGGYILRKMK